VYLQVSTALTLFLILDETGAENAKGRGGSEATEGGKKNF